MSRSQHLPASIDRDHAQAERPQLRGVQTGTGSQVEDGVIRRKQLPEPMHPRTQQGAVSTALEVLIGDSVVTVLVLSRAIHERHAFAGLRIGAHPSRTGAASTTSPSRKSRRTVGRFPVAPTWARPRAPNWARW